MEQPFRAWLGAAIGACGGTGLFIAALGGSAAGIAVIAGIVPGLLLLGAGYWPVVRAETASRRTRVHRKPVR